MTTNFDTYSLSCLKHESHVLRRTSMIVEIAAFGIVLNATFVLVRRATVTCSLMLSFEPVDLFLPLKGRQAIQSGRQNLVKAFVQMIDGGAGLRGRRFTKRWNNYDYFIAH